MYKLFDCLVSRRRQTPLLLAHVTIPRLLCCRWDCSNPNRTPLRHYQSPSADLVTYKSSLWYVRLLEGYLWLGSSSSAIQARVHDLYGSIPCGWKSWKHLVLQLSMDQMLCLNNITCFLKTWTVLIESMLELHHPTKLNTNTRNTQWPSHHSMALVV